MKLDQAVGILTRPELVMQHARRPHKLAVQIFEPGRIGGTPCSAVTDIHVGFDWNAGTILITCAEQLTRLSPEDVEAIRTSVKMGQSWHAYQGYKEQQAKIKLAEARLSWLANEEAMVKHLLTQDGVRYTIRWPNAEEEMADSFLTPEEAIDAARSLEAMEVKST